VSYARAGHRGVKADAFQGQRCEARKTREERRGEVCGRNGPGCSITTPAAVALFVELANELTDVLAAFCRDPQPVESLDVRDDDSAEEVGLAAWDPAALDEGRGQ
jgi:hypothetical protein